MLCRCVCLYTQHLEKENQKQCSACGRKARKMWLRYMCKGPKHENRPLSTDNGLICAWVSLLCLAVSKLRTLFLYIFFFIISRSWSDELAAKSILQWSSECTISLDYTCRHCRTYWMEYLHEVCYNWNYEYIFVRH